MKAKVIDKDFYTPDFEVGEVVEIMKGMEADTADIWNAPNGKAWLCKKQDGTFRYNIPLNLQIIEAEEEHWQELRERTAIEVLPKCIKDVQDLLQYGGRVGEGTIHDEAAKYAVIYADALIKRLRYNGKESKE